MGQSGIKRVARHAKFETKCQSRKNKTGERYYMGNHVCSRVRHVYNNTDGDVQIYHSSDPSVGGWKSSVSFRLPDASHCLDPKQLIGMKLICGYNDSGRNYRFEILQVAVYSSD